MECRLLAGKALILNVHGYRILLDAPAGLEQIGVDAGCEDRNAPNHGQGTDANGKLDVSALDAVLISHEAGLLGLPWLMSQPGFRACVLATLPTLLLGGLLSEERLRFRQKPQDEKTTARASGSEPRLSGWTLPSSFLSLSGGPDGGGPLAALSSDPHAGLPLQSREERFG